MRSAGGAGGRSPQAGARETWPGEQVIRPNPFFGKEATLQQGVPGDAVPRPGRGVSPPTPLLFPGPTAGGARKVPQLDFVHFWEERRSSSHCCKIEAE